MPQKNAPDSKFPAILIVAGFLLLSLWGVHRYFYNRSLTLSDALLASFSRTKNKGALPVHITVGDKISLRIVEAGKIGTEWTVSPVFANHVHGSAVPGQPGNIIIYGHNLNTVFGFLVDTRVGDPINIFTDDGRQHQYTISEIQIVDPSQTQLLAPTTHEVLTLYTCTGFFDSQRFVARAVPEK